MASSSTALIARGLEFLRSRRPLAAWAAWQAALRAELGNPEAIEALERLENAPNLPPQATTPYRFRSPISDRRLAWDERLRSGDLGDLDAAVAAFGDLAEAAPEDSAAVFNYALALAWTGRNREAIAALDLAVSLDAESRPDDAVDAWTLAALLRQGAGAEELADDLSHALSIEFPEALDDPGEWLGSIAVLRPMPSPSAEVRLFEWLDRPMPGASDGLSADDLPIVRASVVLSGRTAHFSSPVAVAANSGIPTLSDVESELFDVISPQILDFDRRSAPLPLPLLDAAVWRFRLPESLEDSSRHRLTREAVERYFEHDWIATPLTSLEGRSPADLVGVEDAALRCKLAAAIRFREGLATRPTVATLYAGYPFDRLRRRLGLAPLDPDSIEIKDVSCMGIGELEALDPAGLDRPTLIEALRSSRAFPGSPAAEKFAEAIEGRASDGTSLADPGSETLN